VPRPKRIPASKTEAFSGWSPPSIESGNIILTESPGSGRVEGADGESWQGEDFDRHLVENLKAGNVPSRLTAGQLENIARQAYQEGHDEGYGNGHAEGMQQGLADGGGEVLQRLAHLDGILARLLAPLQQHEQDLEESITQLVIVIAEAVIKRELGQDSASIATIVKETLDSLPVGADNIRVMVSPGDLEMVAGYMETSDRQWQLQADEQLGPGDCVVRTEQSLVDYTVSARLAQLVEQLVNTPGA
jgi:flagellar assembly protein FliH